MKIAQIAPLIESVPPRLYGGRCNSLQIAVNWRLETCLGTTKNPDTAGVLSGYFPRRVSFRPPTAF
jgi:hypothetical protein